ncbi:MULTISPECIES: YicC/YloC family endoribonuclease [Olivibacter]|uniref:YicC/YloC family endoribonuclease n=1 Tax=Olivibacter jilunii TaxID=985016 RepID=A0ABW6B6V1_9SPHI|nr:YicC family protein [Olivibacter sp. UJ_SKK_5.1]MDX3912371.1 YicC family protein [Pseudosphingobacterium sp.]
MIKSMTGFGLGTKESAKAKYTVEIKSLNSKYLELNLKLPKTFSEKELFLRNECTKLIERGKVNITVNVEYADAAAKAATIDGGLLKNYYHQLKAIATDLGDPTENIFELALNLPEVISYAEEAADEEEWQDLLDTFYLALEKFQQFRSDEGKVLKDDLFKRNQTILELLLTVESQEVARIPLIRERISNYMEEAVGGENVDKNRFEQELIYYIDKLDITEEKVRLRSHCEYFGKILTAPDANGKKLGFISQEMGREINTLGSKANNAQIQQTVVQMKEELEKIKEQLLNIL